MANHNNIQPASPGAPGSQAQQLTEQAVGLASVMVTNFFARSLVLLLTPSAAFAVLQVLARGLETMRRQDDGPLPQAMLAVKAAAAAANSVLSTVMLGTGEFPPVPDEELPIVQFLRKLIASSQTPMGTLSIIETTLVLMSAAEAPGLSREGDPILNARIGEIPPVFHAPANAAREALKQRLLAEMPRVQLVTR